MLNNPYQYLGAYNGISYIERKCDHEIYNDIINDKYYLYMFSPRQGGKSSLIAHTIKKINENTLLNAYPIYIDFSTFTQLELKDQDSFFLAFSQRIERDLNQDFICTIQLDAFLIESVLIKAINFLNKRIIIFLDEIDKLISLEYRDFFFSKIRSFFTSRTTSTDKQIVYMANRVQFILSGVTRIDKLITDPSLSPFNVAKPIELNDISSGELSQLTKFLPLDIIENIEELNLEIYKYTDGSLYLSQLILENIWDIVREDLSLKIDKNLVNVIVNKIIKESSNNIHFINIYNHVHGNNQILKAFNKFMKEGTIDPHNTIILIAIGIIKEEKSNDFRIRNMLYEIVFGEHDFLSLLDNLHKDSEEDIFYGSKVNGLIGNSSNLIRISNPLVYKSIKIPKQHIPSNLASTRTPYFVG
jgi:hypothetical protein